MGQLRIRRLEIVFDPAPFRGSSQKSGPLSIYQASTMVSFNIGSSWASGNAEASSSTHTTLPPDHPPIPSNADACPVDHTARSKWLAATASPDSSNPFYASSSRSRPDSSLTDHREISSIPRGKSATSSHIGSSEGPGLDTHENWVYPSERQFFNAMQRKNHSPKAADMKSVVPIHNAVNEKAWEEILAWEAGMGSEKCGGPRLISFSGRPKDRTPKAWINVALG